VVLATVAKSVAPDVPYPAVSVEWFESGDHNRFAVVVCKWFVRSAADDHRDMGRADKPVERDAILYFNNWDMQCARYAQWKLHISRNTSR